MQTLALHEVEREAKTVSSTRAVVLVKEGVSKGHLEMQPAKHWDHPVVALIAVDVFVAYTKNTREALDRELVARDEDSDGGL